MKQEYTFKDFYRDYLGWLAIIEKFPNLNHADDLVPHLISSMQQAYADKDQQNHRLEYLSRAIQSLQQSHSALEEFDHISLRSPQGETKLSAPAILAVYELVVQQDIWPLAPITLVERARKIASGRDSGKGPGTYTA